MDRNTWMYKIKRNTIEYLRRIDEFLECASEDMRNRGVQTFVCSCEDCQNLRRFGNIKQVRDRLIRRGFMD
jgi:Transposase-associated domain